MITPELPPYVHLDMKELSKLRQVQHRFEPKPNRNYMAIRKYNNTQFGGEGRWFPAKSLM